MACLWSPRRLARAASKLEKHRAQYRWPRQQASLPLRWCGSTNKDAAHWRSQQALARAHVACHLSLGPLQRQLRNVIRQVVSGSTPGSASGGQSRCDVSTLV
eukprot:3226746-Prymnesium_polylepis.1